MCGVHAGGGLIVCGHCGHLISGERKTKKTRKGEREYVYYRCSKYNAKGHPRVRLSEARLDEQVLALFDTLRIEDDDVRDWFVKVLRARARDTQKSNRQRFEDLKQQLTRLKKQKDRLLNLRLTEEIESETFSAKQQELRDRELRLEAQVQAVGQDQSQHAEIAVKAFELSQSLKEKWLKADYQAKRHLLEIICLNFTLDDVTLVPTLRKPFDMLAAGIISKNGRGEWRRIRFNADSEIEVGQYKVSDRKGLF